ncbi:carbohydrate-binding protein, partial [Streptomyces sp. UNOC14_S4]|nr:carbohydrate-binding protein [Streptomyces sp. UNOC14_S4]
SQGHGGGQRPKRRGLLIAAIAVVVVVAGGIGAAMIANNGDSKVDDKLSAGGGDDKPKPQQSGKTKEPSPDPSPSNASAASQLSRDAATLQLIGGASTETKVAGAKSRGGVYVKGLEQQGAGVDWAIQVPDGGDYRLYLSYGVPGKDANLAVTVNDQRNTLPIKMDNHGNTNPGEWSSNWMKTWTLVKLNPGNNHIKISCEAGNQCDGHLDQVWLTPGGA